jgi:uncharacterized protein with gpF-like domain
MNIPVFIKAEGRRRLNIARELGEINRLRLSYEKSLGTAMLAVFAKAGQQAANNFERFNSFTMRDLQHEADVERVLRAHYASVITTFSNRVYDNTKRTAFELLIDQYILLYGANRITGISNTTANIIRGAIFAGEADALGVAAIASLIRERTGGAMGRSRAATIARTETHGAASWATHTAIQDQPLRYNKQWAAVSDSRSRSHHAVMNGVQVGPDEDFIVRYNGVEYRMSHTHDPRGGPANNVNCRCATLYVADEDEIFRD